MKSPLDEGDWLVLDSVDSTQDTAKSVMDEPIGVVFAHDQTAGRGRFGRGWESAAGDSLTMSLIFRSYATHDEPWLVGMAVALAVASYLGARVQWPNDVVMGGKKVGGVLTELLTAPGRSKVPVIGVGLNLNQIAFPPEIAGRATSILLATGERRDARSVAEGVLAQVKAVPEPTDWNAISQMWEEHDDTPGKQFRLPTGELSVAVRVGEGGRLVCTVGDAERSVMAAEAVGV
ncbi:MAG TPA: biotin--[acetyl-CoA-carboxylase] ligase [Fimbriimonadaceae bacterium]|nr:biotin--[acetyl-CoA-carboxylase] ligase [Fimbriimonadaceae bacterium]